MLRNIKLTIQYDGSRYSGWQRLGNSDKTIQGKIEQVLSRMTGKKISLIGSGRTDAGTHALNQAANCRVSSSMSLDDILDYCARYLPDDIIVKEAVEMEDNFHARYRVKSKTYIYKIANGRFYDVFQRKYSWHISDTLNIESMRIASKFLIGTHDFQSFTSLKSKKKSTVRKIYDIAIVNNVDIVEITVKGDGFLHNMVRIIIGTLVEVGLKRLNPESMVSIMEKKERAFAGPTAPPHGLFLKEIEY